MGSDAGEFLWSWIAGLDSGREKLVPGGNLACLSSDWDHLDWFSDSAQCSDYNRNSGSLC